MAARSHGGSEGQQATFVQGGKPRRERGHVLDRELQLEDGAGSRGHVADMMTARASAIGHQHRSDIVGGVSDEGKTAADQVGEIRKLVQDAQDKLDQVTRALHSLENRLEHDDTPRRED